MIRGLRGTVALMKSLYSVVIGRKGRIKMYKIVALSVVVRSILRYARWIL